jgi:ribonucleoside-diphosphate reductase alpha chain
MKFINDRAAEASASLAITRGSAPCFGESTVYRNATRTTIAPTGTISVLANCSSGIEPLYKLAYQRTIMDNDTFVEIHPKLETLVRSKLNERQFNRFKDDLMEHGRLTEDLLHKYKLEDVDYRVWITSHEIPAQWHIKMQAAFQKHVDNAVSKTINLPNSADVRDVAKAFETAWQMGIKGVTVYRDGARAGQVLSAAAPVAVKERPEELMGGTSCIRTGCGSLYVTQNYDKEGLFEVFLQLGKAGGCETALTESTGRLISLARRAGVSVEDIIKQLVGIRCPKPCWDKGVQILSCFDAAGKRLADKANVVVAEATYKEEHCPDCGQSLEMKGGCMNCPYCGYEKCQ